jgi:hypothetical protein
MILSRRELLRAWRQGSIRFNPSIAESQIGLSSIDRLPAGPQGGEGS